MNPGYARDCDAHQLQVSLRPLNSNLLDSAVCQYPCERCMEFRNAKWSCSSLFKSKWLPKTDGCPGCNLQGCSMFTSVKAFEGQQYATLKRQCLQSGLLFEDPRFPATDDSLFYQGNRIGRVIWKRPRVSFFLCSTRTSACKQYSIWTLVQVAVKGGKLSMHGIFSLFLSD